jgi:copper chaperone CopZ
MKRLIIFSLFVLAVSLVQAQFSKASLQASGLTCAMCSKAVKTALEKVSFVKEVKVDIKNQEYNLLFSNESNIDFDVLKQAVEDAGFSVASLKVTTNFEQLKLQKDAHVQLNGSTFHFLNANDQTLNGEKVMTIVDKNFLTAKEFKKISATTKMKCLQSGKAESCCTEKGIAEQTRIYHVTI